VRPTKLYFQLPLVLWFYTVCTCYNLREGGNQFLLSITHMRSGLSLRFSGRSGPLLCGRSFLIFVSTQLFGYFPSKLLVWSLLGRMYCSPSNAKQMVGLWHVYRSIPLYIRSIHRYRPTLLCVDDRASRTRPRTSSCF